MNLTDIKILGDVVSPVYCEELRELGVTDKVTHWWVTDKDYKDCTLKCYEFDMDLIYYNADKAIFHINRSVVFPAYTIKDMDKCIPPYLVSKHANGDLSLIHISEPTRPY